MARTYTYGYYAPSTNKYGGGTYYGGRQGGDPLLTDWTMYGLNYPPPVPSNLTIENWPTTSDHTPIFLWTAVDPEGGSLIFTIEIRHAINDFSSSDRTLDSFVATSYSGGWLYETPVENMLIDEGMYYARIRSNDGYTWSGWSDTLEFEYSPSAPPAPSIDPVTSPTSQFVQLICGTKAPGSHVFVRNNGGDWEEAVYAYGLSGGRWCFSLTLDPGSNNIEVISSRSESTTMGISSPATAVIHAMFSSPEPYAVWNCFDELGLLVSLERNAAEKNKSYKKRILDVYKNPGNSTYQGLINAISRELGIDSSDVNVYRLSDLSDATSEHSILNSDGNAIGTKLVSYVDEVYSHNPIFWGNLISDESVWDSIDEDYSGVSYLPHLWDPAASGIYNKWRKVGIGDQDDLYVKDAIETLDPSGNVYGEVTGSGMMEASGFLRDDNDWRLPIHSGYFYIGDTDEYTFTGWGYLPWGFAWGD